MFEKYAVKTGGGALHRFNLSDCAMIKDNHIRLAGSITKAVEKLRKNLSHAHKNRSRMRYSGPSSRSLKLQRGHNYAG